MAITKASNRQHSISSKVEFTMGTAASEDIGVIGVYPAIDVPEGAIVTGGWINVSTVTTATVDLDVGDATTPARYVNGVDGAALGLTALVPTGYQYTAADEITVSVTVADADAAGTAELVVEYMVDGRAQFSEG